MKLLRLGLASSVVLSTAVFSHGCANNSDDCAYTADCSGSSAGKGGSGGSNPDGGTNSGGDAGVDGNGGSSASGGSSSGGNGGTGENCDSTLSPSEETCLVGNDYGVFVSPLGNPTEGDGTRENPYASLNAAITAAKAAGKLVFACATEGAFEEPLQIDETGDGTRLYGGFSCSDWTYNAETRTVVQSPTSTGLRVTDLVDGLSIEDFEIIASDAEQPGESSMGAFVTNSANVSFTRVSLTAGDGADGEDGEGTMDPAETGASGNAGTAACSGNVENPGGPQVETTCGGVASGSIGGQGGPGGKNASTAGNGDPGLPDLGAGAEGNGEGTNWACGTNGNGQGGNAGTSRSTANGGQGIGALASTGYISVSGQSGGDGTPGQGGGGGGGAKAPSNCGTFPPPDNTAIPLSGASGGSGGGGGCGGKGGEGGKGGGASFVIAAVNSSVRLSQVALIAGPGGDGGDGGYGQPGGDGGDEGEGASGGSGSCQGGPGGNGGNGGHGGGGIGGPSVGIAYVGDAPVQMDVAITVAPVPASGGLDGGGEMTGAGADGLVAKTQAFPSN
jgi:hypothetical protein